MESPDWEKLRELVMRRDKECRLLSRASEKEKKQLYARSDGLHKILDCAHIMSRGSSLHLKYDERNIIALNRYSHAMLDSGKHPITGSPISKEEHTEWWAYLAGDIYPALYKASKQRKSIDDVNENFKRS